MSTMSLVASCWPTINEPSLAQVSPRMRGPIGSSTSLRNGTAASGSASQIDVAALVFWLVTARRRPSGDHVNIPLEKPALMLGALSAFADRGSPSGAMNDRPTNAAAVVFVDGSRYAMRSL